MILSGEVKNVIFRSNDTGYTVLDLRCEESIFTVVGTFPDICAGQNIKVDGKFQVKSAYGKQFFAEKVYVYQPSKLDGIKRFLSSGLIRGMGPVTAEAIVNTFGVDSLEMLKYPLKLKEIRGISLKKATEFGLSYSKIQRMQNAIIFLQDIGITVNMALKIYKVYEDNTEVKVRQNPYLLIDDIDGVGFATADNIASNLGIEKESDYRISASLIYLLKEASSKGGHNYLQENDLVNLSLELLNLQSENAEQRIRDNLEDMVMLGDLIRYTNGEKVAILLSKNFKIELSIAQKLLSLQMQASDFRVRADFEMKAFEKLAGITLHENQKDAVRASVENGINIVTGGPGTGKTTIIKCILYLFKNLNQKVALCAPTGRAAKRLAESTGESAKTIHRLLDLDWKNGEGHFSFNDGTRLPYDVVIVDEVSMVDEYVFNALLKALEKGTRLILVGDKDQLASVGAGNVLADLIKSEKFPVSYLTQIYRQSDDSKIVVNAHKINNGEMPDFDNNSSDFFYEETESADIICKNTVALVTRRLPKFTDVKPINIQVLCPMKRGSAGVYNINRELQKALNGPSKNKREMRHGDVVFREGDKVMQMQNNYKQEWTLTIGQKTERGTGVFNGDIGIIEMINSQIMQFTVRFDDDKVAVYEFSDLEQIALAYAVTIHKAQGSEFDVVVLALDANYMLQTRNLLYTAVTRAKKLVVLEGAKKTISRMIMNNETAKRNSLLLNLINDEYNSGRFSDI